MERRSLFGSLYSCKRSRFRDRLRPRKPRSRSGSVHQSSWIISRELRSKLPARRLLRPRRDRPRRLAAEQRDELAPPDHSITSSARATNDGGTSSASALAVLRLITSSNFVGS